MKKKNRKTNKQKRILTAIIYWILQWSFKLLFSLLSKQSFHSSYSKLATAIQIVFGNAASQLVQKSLWVHLNCHKCEKSRIFTNKDRKTHSLCISSSFYVQRFEIHPKSPSLGILKKIYSDWWWSRNFRIWQWSNFYRV